MPTAPDPHLSTPDGTDRLLLHEADEDLRGSRADVTVLDDRTGALVLGALTARGAAGEDDATHGTRIRSYQDWATSQRSLEEALAATGLDGRVAVHPRLDDALSGAGVVLLRLPKSLDALDETAQAVAQWAHDDVVVYAAGPVKHMTRTMNDVLLRSFGEVHATLGRFKARALVARQPLDHARTAPARYPQTSRLDELDLDVVAHGGVFAGARLDIGTRYLLGFLDQAAPGARHAIDLGCGTGILATSLARSRPEVHVVATDQSAAAVASAIATAHANGVGDRVTGLRDDALSSLPDASADLVVCNPPFHSATTLETDAAHRMFRAAARVLRPGGELWTVYNSHLRHKSALTRTVGPTTMVGQNPKFTVTRSTRAPQHGR